MSEHINNSWSDYQHIKVDLMSGSEKMWRMYLEQCANMKIDPYAHRPVSVDIHDNGDYHEVTFRMICTKS